MRILLYDNEGCGHADADHRRKVKDKRNHQRKKTWAA
jgi:hypothetical protein